MLARGCLGPGEEAGSEGGGRDVRRGEGRTFVSVWMVGRGRDTTFFFIVLFLGFHLAWQ